MTKNIPLPSFAKEAFYDLIGTGAAAPDDEKPDLQRVWYGLNFTDCAEKVHGVFFASSEEEGAWIAPRFLKELEILASRRQDVLHYVEQILISELQQDEPHLSDDDLREDDFVKSCLNDSPRLHDALVSFLAENATYQNKASGFISEICKLKGVLESHHKALQAIENLAQEYCLDIQDAGPLAAIGLHAYPALPFGTHIHPGLARAFAASRLMQEANELALKDQELDQIAYRTHLLLSAANEMDAKPQADAFLLNLAPVANMLDKQGLKLFAENIDDPDPAAFLEFCLTDEGVIEALSQQGLIDHIHSTIGLAIKGGVLSREDEIAFALHQGQMMLNKAGVDLVLRRASCELFARKAMHETLAARAISAAS